MPGPPFAPFCGARRRCTERSGATRPSLDSGAVDASYRRVGAAAGIAYALLATIENLDVLRAPGYGAPAAEVVAAYGGPSARLPIMAGAGALSLAAYLLAVVALWTVVRGPGADAWSVLGLAGGVGAPLIGAVTLALHGTLVLRADGLPPDAVGLLHDLRLVTVGLAGVPIGLFLLGTSVAGRRQRVMPAWLTRPAAPIALWCVAAATTGPLGQDWLRAAVLLGLGLATAWLLVASVWLLLHGWAPGAADSVWVCSARVLAGTVAVAAGVSGAALLAFPSATGEFFSWGLGPPPLASLIGGFYLASCLVYGRAAVAPWAELRVATVGIVALTVPILVATFAHLDLFAFDRLQAWAWVALFGAFPVAATASLLGAGRPPLRQADSAPGTATRAGAAGLAAALGVTAAVLVADPAGIGGDLLPFTPSLLGGRVLAGWCCLLAVLAGWVAATGRRSEGRSAALALAAFPAGALLAAARSWSDLSPPGHRAAYVVALVAWAGAGAALLAATARSQPPADPATPRRAGDLTRVAGQACPSADPPGARGAIARSRALHTSRPAPE